MTDQPTRGVILQPVDDAATFAAMVEEIEALGYDNLWCTDSSLHARNAWMYLTLAATRTQRLTLGTAVTNPLTRHPAITAVAAATLDEISDGRAIMGIGVGDRPLLALGMKPSKLADLETSISVIRELWTGKHITSSDPIAFLDEAHVRIPTRDDVPVYISASGPKTLELAGKVADGVLILAGLFDEALEWAIGHVEAGAAAAGRPRPHIGVCAYGAITAERDDALVPARTIAAWFPQTAPYICSLGGLPDALIDQVRNGYAGGEFQEAAAAASVLPPEFIRKVALAGNSADAEERVRSVLRAGADSVQLFPLGAERMATVRTFVDVWDGVIADLPAAGKVSA